MKVYQLSDNHKKEIISYLRDTQRILEEDDRESQSQLLQDAINILQTLDYEDDY